VVGCDNAGNRTSSGGTLFTYNNQNRLVSSTDGTVFQHSKRGTVTSTTKNGVAAAQVTDGLGRVVQAGPVVYSYDSFDRVTIRTENLSPRNFVYAGRETDPVSDGPTLYHRSPSGAPLALTTSIGTSFTASNRHGDVTQIVTPNAGPETTLTGRQHFDPFGVALTPPLVSIGFQGDWTDPSTKQTWMAARWYQPNSATFTTRDTHPGSTGLNGSHNRHTYGLNNPTRYWDPTGRFSISDAMKYITDYCIGSGNACYGENNVFTEGSLGNMVWGANNHINGSVNFVAGNGNTINGWANVVTGDHNYVDGNVNMVIGHYNKVHGDGNFLIGSRNLLVGDYNMFFGFDDTRRGSNGVHVDMGALGSMFANQAKALACQTLSFLPGCDGEQMIFAKSFSGAIWGSITGLVKSVWTCKGNIQCMGIQMTASMTKIGVTLVDMADSCVASSKGCASANGQTTAIIVQAIAAKKITSAIKIKAATKPGAMADVGAVEQHLTSRGMMAPENQAMIDRISAANASGRPLTVAEAELHDS
jgi:RHS repeat-associated protein